MRFAGRARGFARARARSARFCFLAPPALEKQKPQKRLQKYISEVRGRCCVLICRSFRGRTAWQNLSARLIRKLPECSPRAFAKSRFRFFFSTSLKKRLEKCRIYFFKFLMKEFFAMPTAEKFPRTRR